MIFNVTNGGGGSGCKLTVTAPANVTVQVTKGSLSRTKTADSKGQAVFTGLEGGSWTVTITSGSKKASKTVTLQSDYAASISFNTIPEFTYTGDCEIVNDADAPITTSQGNWKIRFLTSGTLTFTDLNGAGAGIDVFCVGGGGGGARGVGAGGGGGGGGYTSTVKGIMVSAGTAYTITIGAGGIGSPATAGGSSSFGTILSVNGGKGGNRPDNSPALKGGDGGSGGGGGSSGGNGGAGGSDGANGSKSSGAGGTGQGRTTREFGESSGKLYAGGGGGSSTYGGEGGAGGGGNGTRFNQANVAGGNGQTNTGGGGGSGGNGLGGTGGSGIVIIRNKRG